MKYYLSSITSHLILHYERGEGMVLILNITLLFCWLTLVNAQNTIPKWLINFLVSVCGLFGVRASDLSISLFFVFIFSSYPALAFSLSILIYHFHDTHQVEKCRDDFSVYFCLNRFLLQSIFTWASKANDSIIRCY